MKDYHVACFSGGKDSTAMVLLLIENRWPLNEVICCDTGKEFPAMYRHIEKVRKVVEDAGIKFTMLRAERDFNWWMYEYMPKRETSKIRAMGGGFSWPGPRSRWCTNYLKGRVMSDYMADLNDRYNVRQYVGIAYDEQRRLTSKTAMALVDSLVYPLLEWEMTEADCLRCCYERGYEWEGLYEIFGRVSCWCCPIQPFDSLRKLRKHFPDLWAELREMDRRTWRSFLKEYSVEELEIRFALEDEREARGLTINGRTKEFREVLTARLEEYWREVEHES